MSWIKIIAFLLGTSATLWTQSAPSPQSARQALLEMFFSKSPKATERHLPSAALRELHKVDADSSAAILQKMASFAEELAEPGTKLQTFETGSTLVLAEKPETFEKTEIIVERDDLSGDEDEIELSLQVTHNGQPVRLPVVPTLTLSMKQEDDVWRLYDLTVALHMPLGDPDYIRGVMKDIEGAHKEPYEASAVSSVRTILTAEVSYQASYPHLGFACSLAALGGTGQPGEQHAMLIDPTLASGKKNGYTFAISDCSASSFHVTATPINQENGLRSFLRG